MLTNDVGELVTGLGEVSVEDYWRDDVAPPARSGV